MRQDILCKTKTVKVPRGNAFQLLMPFKTAHWEDESIVPEDLDILSLDNVHITIAGIEWTDFEMDPRGPIVTIGADDFDAVGAYSAEITAEYCGVPIRGAFFECFTRVEWSFESNVEQHLPDSPLIAETSYVYIGITDDEELEALKQQYRDATAACETARLQYEAAKEEFDEKAEQLDDVAKESTLLQKSAAIIEAISGIHIDIPDNIATKDDVTAAKQAILDALSHISPEDPYSQALAQFFGLPEALPEIELATEQEVKDINDDVMGALYGYGKVTVTVHSLMRTGAETTQDLASVIYVDPEKTWAENGYPTLYDDEGTAIDTTSNPAAGDEVFNYQIQSES